MLWLAGLAAMQGLPGAAAPGSRAFDLQCMIVTQQAATEMQGKDSNLAMLAQMGAMFYMGRVDGQVSDPQLTNEAEQASAAIEGRPLGPLLTSCGEYMQARGKRFEQVGEELMKRESNRQVR